MEPQLKMMWMQTRVDRVAPEKVRVVGIRRQQAIALVLVLAFLVLLSGLILAFFFSVTNARSTAGQFAHEVDAKMLADAAVNIVQGQIRDATRGQDANTSSLLAWASQPGMIHTFDSGGSAKQMFKLYSADSMVADATGFTPDINLLPADWTPAKYDALYTDLNEPVTNAAGTLDYPIAAPPLDSDGITPLAPGGTNGLIDGYSMITTPPGYSTSKTVGPLNNPAPMPVKWLYLMQDGTLSVGVVAPQNTNAVTVANASSTNPIIGRLAFWADDETAKVNINTASEGNYWDTPHIYSPEDYGSLSSTSTASAIGMAVCQPAQKEYQRYPGHPATTSLSPIFGKQHLPVPALGATMDLNTANTDFTPYFNITPRIIGGGSTGDSLAGTRVPSRALTPDPSLPATRLYASIDELMFTPLLSGSDRARNVAPQNTPGFLTRDMLEKSKFFLTANSSAPETTLYNTPRVAIWPIDASAPPQQTVYDKLIAFCATIHNNPFYFTRSKSRDTTADYTQRNSDLYKYLQKLTGQNVPGYGGNFLSKYGAGTGPGSTGITDRDQILTSIYDYIRCTNLSDTSINGAGAITPFTPPFNGTDIHQDTVARGAGEALPIQINGTQGFGRFYTVSGADLMFCASKPPTPAVPPATLPANAPPTEMQAIFLLEFASPMQGNEGIRSNLKYTVVRGLDKLQVQFKTAAGVPLSSNFIPAGFSLGGSNTIDAADFQTFAGRGLGGNEGLVVGLAVGVYGTPLKLLNNAGGDSSKFTPPTYPFYANIAIPPTAATFQIQQDTTITPDIEVQIQDAKTNAVVQTVHLKFPLSGSFPVPGYVKPYNQRGVVSSQPFPMIIPQDVVAGLEVGGASQTKNGTTGTDIDHTAGDIRMVAALKNVPAGMFRAHQYYAAPQPAPLDHFAYGAPNACGQGPLAPNTNGGYFLGATFGTLVPVTGYYLYSPGKVYVHHPAVPSRVGTFVTRADGITPGDWDTGWGTEKDGAYINKPDEGDGIVKNASDGTPRLPYTSGAGTQGNTPGSVLFSPNRIMPSPLMFGSIPTGVQRNQPWQSLLFNPKPEDPTHPGLGQPGVVPADYLLADLFWMPVVEPYAISQPFSTAGKINLNYQIQPFTYIQRETGLIAVMKATKFLAIPLSDQATYKPYASNNLSYGGQTNRRVAIDAANTCKYFIDPKFAGNQVFKSATEICSINLVPLGENATTAADMARYWNRNKLTGNNLRDKPYVDLYPRLTTKSNTFNVHVRVQSISKARNTPPEQWVTGKDQVAAEYRGSSIVERYIDVNDPNLPDFAMLAVNDPKANIDQYYRMRVVSTRRFSP